MRNIYLTFIIITSTVQVFGQIADTSHTSEKIIIIPYQSMMYFSDADQDISSFSKSNERQVREVMRNNLEANVYHQLLSIFDAISLIRSTTYDGNDELKNIYASTRYTLYSKSQQMAYMEEKQKKEKIPLKAYLDRFKKKSKDQTFWVSDSVTMLAVIDNPEVFKLLNERYHEKYILFLTQFELNTSNKNSIEWMKQKYSREYVLHYNLFDRGGNLLRAEMLTLKGGNEHTLKEINDKYLILVAQKLKEILLAGIH